MFAYSCAHGTMIEKLCGKLQSPQETSSARRARTRQYHVRFGSGAVVHDSVSRIKMGLSITVVLKVMLSEISI